MARRRARAVRGGDRGMALLEYSAAVSAVAVVAVALMVAVPDLGASVTARISEAVCALTGQAACEVADPSEEPEVTLVITIWPGGDAPAERWTLTCSPPGGTHPDPAGACAALLGADLELPEPVPRGEVCTMNHGGPQTAAVTGSIQGTEVAAEFDRINGCEIARWSGMGALLSP